MTKPPPEVDTTRIWNVPNALCAFRFVGSFVLVGLAIAHQERMVFYLAIALILSDWIDGKLAILLKQRTVFGARLDSFADAAMYVAILISLAVLKSDYLLPEWLWIAAALGSYAVSGLAAVGKYGRWPSYHTRGAKVSWFVTSLAVLAVFGGGSPWFLRAAMGCVVLTNIEATCMTFILPRWHADVLTIFHALRLRAADLSSTSDVPDAS